MKSRRFAAAVVLSLLAALPAVSRAEMPPTDWEKIPAEQLDQARPRIEPDADAEVLSWRTWVNDAFENDKFHNVRRCVIRLKVFTEAGAQRLAKVDIDAPLADASLQDVRARCVSPDGAQTLLDPKTIVRDTRVKVRGEGVARTSFAVPGVRPGCIVEYAWTLDRWGEGAGVSTYLFQREIPVQQVDYYLSRVTAPGFFLRMTWMHANFEESAKTADGYYHISARDQRAVPQEPFSPPDLQQTAWMLAYYTSEELKTPAEFWPKLGRRLAGPFDADTRPDDDVRALAAKIVTAGAAEPERERVLEEWMRSDFRVVPKDSLKQAGLRVVDDGRAALRQRGGTPWAAQLAFASLARAAGLEVRLVRLRPADDFFFEAGMMDLSFLRSYQVAVRLDGEWQCFDPSPSYLPAGMVPRSEESQLGLFCDRDSSGFIGTSVSLPAASEMRTTGRLALAEDGSLAGDLVLRLSGHLNALWRSDLEDAVGAQVDSVVDRLGAFGASGAHVDRITIVPGPDTHEPLEVRCHVSLPDFATVTDRRIVLEPSAWRAHAPIPFTAAKRTLPILFSHTWLETDSLDIALPSGWTCAAPEEIKPLVSPRLAGYHASVSVSADGRTLGYRRRFEFGTEGTLLFAPASYEGLKLLFEQVLERDRFAVTLERGESKP